MLGLWHACFAIEGAGRGGSSFLPVMTNRFLRLNKHSFHLVLCSERYDNVTFASPAALRSRDVCITASVTLS